MGIRFLADDGRYWTLYFNDHQLGVWDNKTNKAVWVLSTK